MIALSACLAGIRCRYDGRSCPVDEALELHRLDGAIAFCPEEQGGLPTPRPPCEIVGGDGGDVLDGRARVLDVNGVDRSDAFIAGAQEMLRVCRNAGVKTAWLKGNSPSCGCGAIYDGSFSGTLRAGDGVTAALLKRNGIAVVSK